MRMGCLWGWAVYEDELFMRMSCLWGWRRILPIGEQSLSSRTNITRTSEMAKYAIVRAAGDVNSVRPVNFPRALSSKLGRIVAEAARKDREHNSLKTSDTPGEMRAHSKRVLLGVLGNNWLDRRGNSDPSLPVPPRLFFPLAGVGNSPDRDLVQTYLS